MKKTLKIKLTFIDMTPDEDAQNGAPVADPTPDISEFVTDAEYTTGERCEILYKENPDLGMGTCAVRISWLEADPSVISVVRNGETQTVMSFEEGKRHISRYDMGSMAFELTTRTLRSFNNFDGTLEGEIYVDYIVEVRGGFVGRRKMSVKVLP